MDGLVGSWRQQGAEACAAPYPADLRFLPGGQYRGTAATPGEYTAWDVGTWAEPESGVLALSTANDAVIRYRYRLAGETLEFEDPDGCTVRYVRNNEG